MSLRDFFENPTIAGLARQIEMRRLGSSGLNAPAIERVDRSARLPLSFLSAPRVGCCSRSTPAISHTTYSLAIRIGGSLDVVALTRSFCEIVRRHESLRTIIAEMNGEPAQVIEKAWPLALPVIDLLREPENIREEKARRLASEQAQQPFSLERGPLFRAALARLGQQEHILLFTVHHIISDGWSIGVLIRELATLYEAFSNGKPSPLPELPVQYADFASWQRRRLRGDLLESHLSYWRKQLAGAPIAHGTADGSREGGNTYLSRRKEAAIACRRVDRVTQIAKPRSRSNAFH